MTLCPLQVDEKCCAVYLKVNTCFFDLSPSQLDGRTAHSLVEIGRYFFLTRVGLFVCFLSSYVVKYSGLFVHF